VLRSRLRRNAGSKYQPRTGQNRVRTCVLRSRSVHLSLGKRSSRARQPHFPNLDWFHIAATPYSILWIPSSGNNLHEMAVSNNWFLWSVWGWHERPYPNQGTVTVPLRAHGLYRFNSLLSLIEHDCGHRSTTVFKNAGGTPEVDPATEYPLGPSNFRTGTHPNLGTQFLQTSS
jgi:hypothetical protein